MVEQPVMSIFGSDISAGPDAKPIPLWSFKFQKDPPIEDVEGRPDDGVKGHVKFSNGDRMAYHSAYCFLEHEDPGHHEYLKGFRFAFQDTSAPGTMKVQINDKYMGELEPQGREPYPYENEAEVPAFDRLYPGGQILFCHHRPDATRDLRLQLLYTYTIPALSPQNEKVRWFYQRSGFFLAVHEDAGPITRLVVTSLHPRYAFGIRGLPPSGFGAVEKRNPQMS